jgi:hypothetical protein
MFSSLSLAAKEIMHAVKSSHDMLHFVLSMLMSE